jgi:hypothetical protein
MPTMHGSRESVAAGGLLSYGPNPPTFIAGPPQALGITVPDLLLVQLLRCLELARLQQIAEQIKYPGLRLAHLHFG